MHKLVVAKPITSRITPPQPLLESIHSHSVPYHLFPNRFSPSTLVFVSGWVCPVRTTWEPLLPLLADQYSLLLLEKRGHANVPIGNSTPATYFDDSASDLRSALDHARIRSVDLVAHSMGGFIARRFYERFPERVRSITFICSPFDNPLESWFFGNEPAVAATVSRVQSFLGAIPAINQLKSFVLAGNPIGRAAVKLAISGVIVRSNGVWNSAFDRFYRELMDVPFSTIRLQLQAMLLENPHAYTKYGIPTLYVAGSIDPMVQLQRLPHIPTSELVVLSGMGHLPQLECPIEVAQAITQFLSRSS